MTLCEKLASVLPPCGDRCVALAIVALIPVMLGVMFLNYREFGLDVMAWDWMLLSGLLVAALGLRVAHRGTKTLDGVLSRLGDRGVLDWSQDEAAAFWRDFNARAERCSRVLGLLIMLALLAAFTLAFLRGHQDRLPLALFEGVYAYIVGVVLGRMAWYGGIGRALRKAKVKMHVYPGHVDGAAGMKPVGDFFFRQALLVVIPAVYLGAWLLLIPSWPRDYSDWHVAYFWLLAVVLLIEVAAFVLPMWSFHKVMVAKKSRWRVKADEISRAINKLQGFAETGPRPETRSEDDPGVEALRRRFEAIEAMPTWPVDRMTRKRFRLNNLMLLFPLVVDTLKGTSSWRGLSEHLAKWLS